MPNPWSGTEYESGDIAPGVGNGEIACAIRKGTREVWWRYDDGTQTWASAPVLAGTVPIGTALVCRTHMRGQRVIVTNGIDWGRQSRSFGYTETWSDL